MKAETLLGVFLAGCAANTLAAAVEVAVMGNWFGALVLTALGLELARLAHRRLRARPEQTAVQEASRPDDGPWGPRA